MSVSQAVPLAAPSILDRLLDDAPDLSVDVPRTRQAQMRDALASLRRDLEWLLNTRCCATTPPGSLPQLRRSLLSFGVSDFIGANMTTVEQRRTFAGRLEATVHACEPRLQNVSVSVLDPRESTERVLRLRIEATILLEDSSVPVLFTSSVNPTTLRFSVAEASYV